VAIAVRSDETPPQVAKRLRVSLFWLGREPFVLHKTYLLKLGTARTRFQIEQILRVMNTSSLANTAGQEQVGLHEVAECLLSLEHAIACDRAGELPETGRFVVVDGYEIRGGGIVLEALPDTQSDLRETVFQRNIHWILSDVTEEERTERYKQRASLVIITGRQGTGRKRLARALESHLFHAGGTVYFLGMGSVIHGVDADIPGHTDNQDRREHIRRVAEIAHIFLDAGIILIVTAVELTQADLELFQTIVDPTRMVTIWMGEQVSTDIQVQLKLEQNQPTDQSITRILGLLNENGSLGDFFHPAN
jgi:bifunctional enzyme CysN/CysC